MDVKSKELYDKLNVLEKKVLEGNFDANLKMQSHKSDIERLREIVDELKSQDELLGRVPKKEFDDIGRDISVTSSKLQDLSNQIKNLEERTEVLEEHKSKSDNRVWSYVEKAVIAIISGLMTLLFNNLSG